MTRGGNVSNGSHALQKQAELLHTVPDAMPLSAPDGFASRLAAATPTAVMIKAPGYWNSAPDSRPPGAQIHQTAGMLSGRKETP